MSNRTEALAFLNLVSQYRQERQLDVLKDKADEANRIQSGIKHAARRQERFARQQERKQDQLALIRQRVFDASKDMLRLKTLLEGPEYAQHNLADHVAYMARSLGMRLQSECVAVENVAEYVDKDRVDAMYGELARVYNLAVERVAPNRLEQMERAFQYRKDVWRLQRFLDLETKWQQVQPVRAALAPLYEKRKENEGKLAKVLARQREWRNIGIAFVVTAVLAWPLLAEDDAARTELANPFSMIFGCISVPFFLLSSRKGRTKSLVKESVVLNEQIASLRKQDVAVSLAELERLRGQFGQRSREELKRMIDERTALIASFESAVDYKEVGLFESATARGTVHAESHRQEDDLLRVAPIPGGLFAVCGNGGEWFDGWGECFRELVIRNPDYEDLLGTSGGEVRLVMSEVEKGAYFVVLTQTAKTVVLSKKLPVSFVGEEYHTLYQKLLRIKRLEVEWINDLNTSPKTVKFEHALTEG